MKICPKCGRQANTNNENVCGFCGIKLEEHAESYPTYGGEPTVNSSVCRFCGKSFDSASDFCPHCGNKAVPVLEDRPREIYKAPAKNHSALIAVLIVLVILLTGVIVYLVIQNGNNGANNLYDSYERSVAEKGGKDDSIDDSEEYEEPQEEPQEEPEEEIYEEPSEITCRVVNCNEEITLRSSPSINASQLTSIPRGAEVVFIDESENGFYKVEYSGYYGYCLSSFLDLSQPYDDGNPVATAEVVNCTDYITLRSIPSTSGEEFDRIRLGETVVYICDAENGFCCVEYSGQRGFALKKYLSF